MGSQEWSWKSMAEDSNNIQKLPPMEDVPNRQKKTIISTAAMGVVAQGGAMYCPTRTLAHGRSMILKSSYHLDLQ